jgi:hypothetical protein
VKQYKTQASKDSKAKLGHYGIGGDIMPNKDTMKDPKAMMNPMRKSGGAAKAAPKAKAATKSNPKASGSPVPISEAPGAGAEPIGGMRPPVSAPAGLGAMQLKKGGRACRAAGGRAHKMDAGAESGEGRLEKIGRK